MKKIALTQRLVKVEERDEIRESLDINYCNLMDACGFLPMVLPYEIDFRRYFDEISVDGIVLTGGNDLDSCHSDDLNKKRDEFEKELLKHCIIHNIPVLGICRGMQLIAEYFGAEFTKVNNQVNVKHGLIINQDSKYSSYLNAIKEVNSYHNFTIKNLSHDLLIAAKNQQGTVKAIEHKNYRVFGQMWHSEREKPFEKVEMELIRSVL